MHFEGAVLLRLGKVFLNSLDYMVLTSNNQNEILSQRAVNPSEAVLIGIAPGRVDFINGVADVSHNPAKSFKLILAFCNGYTSDCEVRGSPAHFSSESVKQALP